MKHCAIVRDLLPMYIEELTSEESGEFIREHLSQCDECRAEYERMTAPTPPPVTIRKEWKDAIWEEMKRKDRRKITKRIVAILLAVLLLAGYVLRKGLLLDSDLIMRPPLQGQVVYLEEREDGFLDGYCEIRFAVYNPEQDWIQICFSLPKDEDSAWLSIELDYYLDGQEVEHSFTYGRDTWIKNYENVFIENVGEFSELRLVLYGETVIISNTEGDD